MTNSMSHVRAVLGPTNTGKTHLAVERMIAHDSGMIGLPLRLLAREVYDKLVAIKGERLVALVTGEERIIPRNARYYACTVEAMPLSIPVSFLAIDEIQIANNPDRGHVFTDRILYARGRHETMLLGADTMRPVLHALNLKVDTEHRERFSTLTYTGPLKLTKLPKRSAIVAFSSEEVYAIAELLKRQRGGAAVVMGALSPRTRNAQVELYQSGEVDYLVATDAIGMGLNLDVTHIAFASRSKFDGHRSRSLHADEAAQIAGRAGRFKDNGTFGETSDCRLFEEEDVQRIENHTFDPVIFLTWRNSKLNYETLESLSDSLHKPSPHRRLKRCPDALDEITFQALRNDSEIKDSVKSPEHVRRLWDLCTLPDFRKHGPDAHVRLVQSFVEKLINPNARLQDAWINKQLEKIDNIEGDIDTLQSRLASIRTWTYAANRTDWVQHTKIWQSRTRDIEDRLSDALHERLVEKFVDRRTSALLKSLNSEEAMEAGVGLDGEVVVEGHSVGRLDGLTFSPAVTSQTLEGRAVRNAAYKALKTLIEEKLNTISVAEDGNFSLLEDYRITYQGQTIGRMVPGSHWLSPSADLVGAPDAETSLRALAETRLRKWLADHIKEVLTPLFDLQVTLKSGRLTGLARGVAHQLVDAGAAIDRRKDEVASSLTRDDRAALKEVGVRTGRIAAYMPGLLKPAQAGLCLKLRALGTDYAPMKPPSSASFKTEKGWNRANLEAAGYVRLGPRAVRADMAERLSWTLGQERKKSETSTFAIPPEHAALVGSPADDFIEILKAMGLMPAQKDKETNAITLWRFSSKQHVSEKKKQKSSEPTAREVKAMADSPFAALAALTITKVEDAPAKPKKKRKRKKAKTSDAVAAPEGSPTAESEQAPSTTPDATQQETSTDIPVVEQATSTAVADTSSETDNSQESTSSKDNEA